TLFFLRLTILQRYINGIKTMPHRLVLWGLTFIFVSALFSSDYKETHLELGTFCLNVAWFAIGI
ncbi:MAG TPA: hypothetical protein VGB63_05060, partial [Pedobacter sp.]